ncbi:uncharacterized protein DNG_10193 [Cephalotrichum gorgonifer]|uniref:Uncharacterized protein n=1 Tax=Cephalotrichum gorgonifer TaxID=2041049 RepID=A0AAE8SZZ4_9PEZI|nr:uncharacterized protein DNG_10193 [Cephalotrichum gorgonifer]
MSAAKTDLEQIYEQTIEDWFLWDESLVSAGSFITLK